MNKFDRTKTRSSTKHLCALAALLLGAALIVVEAQAENPPPIAWIQQFGTPAWEYGYGVTTDAVGHVFITGSTLGSLGGTNAGYSDAFVSNYDTAGNLAWTRQLGTADPDHSMGVATDASGNVFITGYTHINLGDPYAWDDNVFVAKYDPTGDLIWTRQLGTLSGDQTWGIATDAVGNLFITGETYGSLGGTNAGYSDAFVTKYDTDGNVIWTRQLGTPSYDASHGVTTDSAGNVFITGSTASPVVPGSAILYDAFVSKYDTDGNLAWTRQLGTPSYDNSSGVATDAAGNVYITGRTDGDLDGPNAGGTGDAFVSKYDTEGNLVWTRQIGTSGGESSRGVATDAAGNVFITGSTTGSLGGPNAGEYDVFVSKYDTLGNLAWIHQLGTSNTDRSYSVTTDAAGNVYITGDTYGELGGPKAGGGDTFLAKFASITALGDANNDQQINLADLQILGDNWQSSGANWATGDFTGDGIVDLADLQVLGDNWGYGVGADIAFEDALLALPGVGLNVPEPTALSVLMLCCLAGELARTTRSKLRG